MPRRQRIVSLATERNRLPVETTSAPRYHRHVKVRACYFVVESDGTFWRLPKKTFYRILQQSDAERRLEFAG